MAASHRIPTGEYGQGRLLLTSYPIRRLCPPVLCQLNIRLKSRTGCFAWAPMGYDLGIRILVAAKVLANEAIPFPMATMIGLTLCSHVPEVVDWAG